MKHKHIFKQVAGGCSIADGKCDANYECKCGEKFKMLCDKEFYFKRYRLTPINRR